MEDNKLTIKHLKHSVEITITIQMPEEISKQYDFNIQVTKKDIDEKKDTKLIIDNTLCMAKIKGDNRQCSRSKFKDNDFCKTHYTMSKKNKLSDIKAVEYKTQDNNTIVGDDILDKYLNDDATKLFVEKIDINGESYYKDKNDIIYDIINFKKIGTLNNGKLYLYSIIDNSMFYKDINNIVYDMNFIKI